MRLRKNMKRAAAAALALSVALSAAAPAALAKDYYIENGDITVTVTEEGDTYVRVGEAKDKDDIGEKDDTDVVIKGGENPGKQTENNSDGSADEAEGQKPVVDAEPGEPAEETGTELVVWPENVNSGEAQKKDGPEPADAEPKTPDTQKPVEEAAEDDDDIMTFENNTAGTVTRAVSEAAKHIITIINNYTKKDTTVTLEDVNIDVSDNYNAAMEVRGAGDTTLKLEGDNTLRGGHFCAGLEKDDEYSTGKLTITAEDTSASLKAYGGDNSAGIGGGSYDSTSKLEIANGKIYAESGFNMGAGIGGGFRGSGDVTILGGTVTAIPAEGSNSNVTGIGGGFGCDEKSTVRILGGVVDAVGNGCGSGIGGGKGDAQGAEVASFDDPAFREVMMFMQECVLQKIDSANFGPGGDDDEQYRNDFFDGKTAMLFNGVWDAGGSVDCAAGAENIKPANFPTNESGKRASLMSGGTGFVVSNSLTDAQTAACIEFIKYMTSEEIANKIIAFGIGMAPNTNVDYATLMDSVDAPEAKLLVSACQLCMAADYQALGLGNEFGDFEGEIQSKYAGLKDGSKTVDDVVKELDAVIAAN